MDDNVKRYVDYLDTKIFGMDKNKAYDYLIKRFNKAFEVGLSDKKQEYLFEALIIKLSQIEKEIKEK